MRTGNVTGISYKGHDVTRLRGLYMQGLCKRGHSKVFEEMKIVANKEGLDLFLNQANQSFEKEFSQRVFVPSFMTIWGQDKKAFIKNKLESLILWNTKDGSPLHGFEMPYENIKIREENYFPRGGNYYLGYNKNGERWLLIHERSIKECKKNFNDTELPSREQLVEIFDVKKENIITLPLTVDDLDEMVRPVGFPYVLVNDYKESLNNLELMKEKFPKSDEVYYYAKKYLEEKISGESVTGMTEQILKILSDYGFKPIKIGARYHHDINYLNALAWENNSGKISYLTNSTKDSYPELDFLESLFDKLLREKIPEISDVYYISGGERTDAEKNSEAFANLMSMGFNNRNVIMDTLATYQGGIHCMTAEIPEELFEK